MSLFARPAVSLRRALRRGSGRLLVLKVLSSRPMHGYEIAKQISSFLGGKYEPSPGLIYPTLQSLEDQDLVSGRQDGGKKVYTITAAGRADLKRGAEELEAIVRLVDGSTGGDWFPLRSSAARLERTILVSLPDMSSETMAEVAGILDEASSRISRVIGRQRPSS
jgi:DNA-binding PadR family transcriptional regulator